MIKEGFKEESTRVCGNRRGLNNRRFRLDVMDANADIKRVEIQRASGEKTAKQAVNAMKLAQDILNSTYVFQARKEAYHTSVMNYINKKRHEVR